MVSQNVRRAERVKSLLRAQIIFNNRNSTVDCVIKNISPLGAKLVLGETTSVPSQFELYVPRRGRTYLARMAWRDTEAIGVEFFEEAVTRTPPPPPSEESEVERIRHLEVLVSELKARVRVLSKRLVDLGQDPDIAA
jgi:hypothetical protein